MSAKNSESVKELFSSLSQTYDKGNFLITFGLHIFWKKTLVRKIQAKSPKLLLDCATGTGDVAFEMKKKYPQSSVSGVDFSEPMIQIAKKKDQKKQIQFKVCDILKLPFEDEIFDVVTISYGIRNVPERKKAIQEMVRTLKKQGQLLILETGNSEGSFLGKFISFYMKKIMPFLGGWTSGQVHAYDYLNETSHRFPSRKGFEKELMDLGIFKRVQSQSVFFGASFIYEGIKE